ncbi:hypothetical protein [Paenibacillus massiliensis]|uniref:hypothetical protein n=1 Tax=Paenibacillus massiliensis TaxID=225917 RepID=UPI00040468E9|nr:hypothetical protein [Paenibacillus massiliensis]
MQELAEAGSPFTLHTQQLPTGMLFTIRPIADEVPKLSLHRSSSDPSRGEVQLCIYEYTADGLYHVHYVTIDRMGQLLQVRREQEGVLPAFFTAPDGTRWVSLSDTQSEGAKEIVLPLDGRERITKRVTSREFPVDADLSVPGSVLLYNYDMFNSKKPPRLCSLEFNDEGLYQKRKIHKIPLPSTDLVLRNEEGIHLLYEQEGQLQHSIVNETGEVLHTRKLMTDEFIAYPLSISMHRDSILLSYEDERVRLMVADATGAIIRYQELLGLEEGQVIYSLFRPVMLDDQTWVVRFTSEQGNGWFVIHGEELKACYVRSRKRHAYVELLSQGELPVPAEDMIIHDVVRWDASTYGMVMYSKVNPREAYVLIP